MAKTNKKASMGVMNLLKSVMDYKVGALKNTIDAGRRAALEEADICEHISNLQQYIYNACRYDPVEAREAEVEVYNYETQAAAVRKKIVAGEDAKKQLHYAGEFYKTYADIKKNQESVRGVLGQRATLEDRIAVLEKHMEACEINMMPGLYSLDIVEQAQREYDMYAAECAELYKRLQDCR